MLRSRSQVMKRLQVLSSAHTKYLSMVSISCDSGLKHHMICLLSEDFTAVPGVQTLISCLLKVKSELHQLTAEAAGGDRDVMFSSLH